MIAQRGIRAKGSKLAHTPGSHREKKPVRHNQTPTASAAISAHRILRGAPMVRESRRAQSNREKPRRFSTTMQNNGKIASGTKAIQKPGRSREQESVSQSKVVVTPAAISAQTRPRCAIAVRTCPAPKLRRANRRTTERSD